jgi:ArsR family transcriptional regulator, lead/cadmium/zinc/bismuth-responsive transcriptional repressor
MNNKKIEICECNTIHKDVIDAAKKIMHDDLCYDELSEFFKGFTDPARLKILTALSHSEMCVCDLVELLQMSQPAVSHHLKLLKSARIIKYKKDGKFVYYSLDDNHISGILSFGLEHIKE